MRTRNANLFLAGLLISCGGYETGIDRSVIQGTLALMPELAEESETEQGSNDEALLAVDLGYLGYRVFQVSGSCLEFDNFSGQPAGDMDWYVFSAQAGGTLAISFEYPSETASYDVTVYDLDLVDAEGDPTAIGGGSTADSAGAFALEVEVVEGGSYAVRVGGLRNPDGDAGDYMLTLWGMDPNGVDFLVGAYAEEDPFARTSPLGGTSVSEFTWDDASMSWSGPFEVLAIRSLTTTYEGEGEDEVRTDVVDEAIASVWMHAGSYNSLNSSILAGVSYASTAVQVTLSTDDATTDLHTGVELAIDETQPIQIGWEFAETEPNDVELDQANYVLVGDLSAANELPVASGLGYVDLVTGALTFEVVDPAFSGDNDVFALTSAESLGATITLDWDDAGADIDMFIFNQDGQLVAYAASVAKPEVAVLSDFGATIEPGQQLLLQLLGYSAAEVGDKTYEIAVEYSSP